MPRQTPTTRPALRPPGGRTAGRAGRCRRGRGYSLIEVLVVVAILSIVLSSVAVALQSMFRIDRRLRDEASYAVVLPRLALQLRDDVHAAVAAEAGDGSQGGPALKLRLPDRQVEYEARDSRVIRIVRNGDQQQHQEVFFLHGAERMAWSVSGPPARMVRLRVERRVGQIDRGDDSLRIDHVDAAVGTRPGAVAENTAGQYEESPP